MGQRHVPAAFYPQERPSTHCTGGWVGPRTGLDGGKSRPTGNRFPDRPARSQSLYRQKMHSNPLICTTIRQTVYKVSFGYYTGSLRTFIFSICQKITINSFSKKFGLDMSWRKTGSVQSIAENAGKFHTQGFLLRTTGPKTSNSLSYRTPNIFIRGRTPILSW